MLRKLRIGTRASKLALYQANKVKSLLEKSHGIECELVEIKSDGEYFTKKPLYELGIEGIFTKTLDAALINDRIDLAVHSLKDVPTSTAEGLSIKAILKRSSAADVLVHKKELDFNQPLTIATSSLRRKSQWLHKYPHHQIVSIRGNVQTRLATLEKNEHWDGAIFADAGLIRLNIEVQHKMELDWMIPAPGQGAITIVTRDADTTTNEYVASLNDENTQKCVTIERDFLKQLMGGCSKPIAGHAQIIDGKIIFNGNMLSLDGSKAIEINKTYNMDQKDAGKEAANELISDPHYNAISLDLKSLNN